MLDDPTGQAALVGVGQLLGGVVMDFAVEGQRTLGHPPALVEDEDAAAGCAHVFKRQLQDSLKELTQIELAGQLTADGVQQV